MKKIILSMFFFSFLFLSGCSINKEQFNNNLYPYRNITEQEINNIIPYGYKITNNFRINAIKNKYNDKNTVLIVSPKDSDAYIFDESKMPEIIVLGFNRKDNTWNIVSNVYNINSAVILDSSEITDLDSDGLNELHLLGTAYCGSTCYYNQHVFDFKNGIIKDLLNQKNNTSLGKDGIYFNSDKKEYYIIDYILDVNNQEKLFDCHHFNVDKYKFNESSNKFELSETLKTNVRYNFDLYGNKNEKCNDYEKIQALRDVELLETPEDSKIPLLDLDLSKYKKK